MKSNSTIAALAMLAALNVGISSSAATTIDVNMFYIGSTTGNANMSTKVAQNTGTGKQLNWTNSPGGDLTTIQNGLTHLDLRDPSIQGTANLKNYFALYVDYVPNAPTDRLYGFAFNVQMPTGMAPVASNNISDNTTNKFLLWNPTNASTGAATWDQAGDFGDYAGDLQTLAMSQNDPFNAYEMAVGTSANTLQNGDDGGYIPGRGTLLGLFALKFTATNVRGTVSLTGVAGSTGWYYFPLDTSVTFDDSALHFSPSIAVGTPEPASLGVLALGGSVFLVRRRRR